MLIEWTHWGIPGHVLTHEESCRTVPIPVFLEGRPTPDFYVRLIRRMVGEMDQQRNQTRSWLKSILCVQIGWHVFSHRVAMRSCVSECGETILAVRDSSA